ncbi:MAG TPA: hypothetical protein VLA19_17925 [Herpetosiphonaceae bacterium]|nr:hypothetical protein [Herpetosiphonaceae bacterium]
MTASTNGTAPQRALWRGLLWRSSPAAGTGAFVGALPAPTAGRALVGWLGEITRRRHMR